MTDFEQTIYNLHLKTSRTKQNKPFKFRQKFDKFEADKNYVYVKKLASFFGKYNHVNIEDFFGAPYNVYPDAGFYDLKFYTTQKAIKAFSLHKQKVENSSPNSVDQIEFTKRSMLYIYNFCKENKIPLAKYLDYKAGTVRTFLVHLKEGHINLYTLFYFKDLHKAVQKSDLSVIEFMFPNFFKKVETFRTRYNNTPDLKKIVQDGFFIINQGLNR